MASTKSSKKSSAKSKSTAAAAKKNARTAKLAEKPVEKPVVKPAARLAKTAPVVVKNAAVTDEKDMKDTPKETRTSKLFTVASFQGWNKWLALIYAAQAVALVVLARSHPLPVNGSLLMADELASKAAGHQVLGMATQHLFDINIVFLLVATLLVATIAHALLAGKYRIRYEAELGRKASLMRWLEYGVSGALIVVTVAMLVGVYDVATLLLLAGSMLIAGSLGAVRELWRYVRGGTSRVVAGAGIAAASLPWLVIFIYVLNAWTYKGDIPMAIAILVGTIALCYALFGMLTRRQLRLTGRWNDYSRVERAYLLLGLLTKSALVWQVYAAVLR